MKPLEVKQFVGCARYTVSAIISPCNTTVSTWGLMKVLVSGASGLVGRALIPALEDDGHAVLRLVRHPVRDPGEEMQWNPYADRIDESSLPPFDAVIHLSGESITGRWNKAKKRAIYDSRIRTTAYLAECMERMERPPAVWLCASAIGFYGDRGDEVLDEDAQPGSTYLASVCEDWEKATKPATDRGVRVVNMRLGVVLAKEGGTLPLMMRPFKMGVGGIIGNGKQYLSWITLDDLIAAILFALSNDSLSGPVNFVAPQPATNRDFTNAMGNTLKRPTLFRTPGFALRAALGEMAKELVLASTRVVPQKLSDAGFQFEQPDISGALDSLLNT